MRKQMKKKKRSCGLCKPHKKGMDNRWKYKDREELKQWGKIKSSESWSDV